ncbi:lipoate--protein ligase family protein [Metallumcola ferriviriculae]|uniref:Lipoate--protein ligase family protein n=1 Tax=Metallumcola ferriviriculae TaxID=3039180 RepID=A0AAU0UJX1_9FIRM|nr:lipoate--protein ligase family protein [Desulfitibacteraceae bacterium MK1]
MSKSKWRLLNTGCNPGAYNMAVDEKLLHQVITGDSLPIIRFYSWAPAAISLGYFQKPEEVLDLAGCRDRNIDVVKRITGGRAVLHHYEVTYSIIASENETLVSGSIIQSYLKISKALLRGLRSLSIPAELVPHGGKKKGLTTACFDAPSWYELTISGKKLAGSAQTRKQGALLQHGSILLDLDINELADTMKFSGPQAKDRFKRMMADRACAINQIMPRQFTVQEVTKALTNGFIDEWQINAVPDKLTKKENRLIAGRMNKAKGKAVFS